MEGLAKRLEKMIMAITFAEARDFDKAIDILSEEERPQKANRIQPSYRVSKEVRVSGSEK